MTARPNPKQNPIIGEIERIRNEVIHCVDLADSGTVENLDRAADDFAKIDVTKPMQLVEEEYKRVNSVAKFNAEKAKHVKFAEKALKKPVKTVRKMVSAKEFTPADFVKLITLMKDVARINKIINKKKLLHKSKHGLMKYTMLRFASKLGQYHIYLAEMNDWIHFTPGDDPKFSQKALEDALDHVADKKMQDRAAGKEEITLDEFLDIIKYLHKKSKEELAAMKGTIVASEFGSFKIDDIDNKHFHIEGFPGDVWVSATHPNMALRFAAKTSTKKIQELDALFAKVKPHSIASLADLITKGRKWKDQQFADLAQFDDGFKGNEKFLKLFSRLFHKR